MDSPNIKNSIALVWFAQACRAALAKDAWDYLNNLAQGFTWDQIYAVAARNRMIGFYVDALKMPDDVGLDLRIALRDAFPFGFGKDHAAVGPSQDYGQNVNAFLADLHGMAMLAYAKSQKGE